LRWLGIKWNDVVQELMNERIDYSYVITYPTGKAIPSGELRVVRWNQVEGKLKFVVLHDRFIK